MNASADAVPPHANGEGGNPRGDGLARAWSILLKIMSIEVAVLVVVTGIALFFLYRPPLSHAFAEDLTHGRGWSVRTSSAVRRIFRGLRGDQTSGLWPWGDRDAGATFGGTDKAGAHREGGHRYAP